MYWKYPLSLYRVTDGTGGCGNIEGDIIRQMEIKIYLENRENSNTFVVMKLIFMIFFLRQY